MGGSCSGVSSGRLKSKRFVFKTEKFIVWRDVWEDAGEDPWEDHREDEKSRHTRRQQGFREEAREDVWEDSEESAREDAARARLAGALNRCNSSLKPQNP